MARGAKRGRGRGSRNDNDDGDDAAGNDGRGSRRTPRRTGGAAAALAPPVDDSDNNDFDAADALDDVDQFMRAREQHEQSKQRRNAGKPTGAIYDDEEDDEEEEVFALPDGEEEDDDDDEEEEEDDGGVELDNLGLEKRPDREISLKAWGKTKKPFYGADVQDDELSADEDVAEEEEEVRRLQQERLSGLKDEDFELDDSFGKQIKKKTSKVDEKKTAAAAAKTTKGKAAKKTTDAPAKPDVELIERDLSGLTPDELREIVQKDSPELIQLLADLREKTDEIKQHLQPLLEQVRSGAIKTDKGISLLDVKYQLLLSYCTNICFYVYLKVSGASVKDHPVLLQLVEQRALIEKFKPLEAKLRYQIDKLIKAASDAPAAANGADNLRFRPNIGNLLPARDAAVARGETNGTYKAPRITPMPFEGAQDKEQRKAERQRSKAAASRILRDLRNEFSNEPEEVTADDDMEVDAAITAREQYEEEHFVRLPETRADRALKRKRLETQFRNEFEDLNDFVTDRDDDDPLGILRKPKRAPQPAEMPADDDAGDMFGDDDNETEGAFDGGNRKNAKQRRQEARKPLAGANEDGESAFVDDGGDAVDGKRGATYQIIKNKGLTVKRKKEQRNPRVKRRLKYEQAQKKMKSAGMRVVERELKPYGGEATGIKANVSRSVKLK